MEELSLLELVRMFWKKKIQIIVIVLLFVIIGVIYTTKMVKPMYTASTTLVLTSSGNQDNKKNATNSITASDITVNSKLVSTYSKLVKSKNILDEVISNLGINIKEEDLKKNITVSSIEDTELIEIKVKDINPENSSKIANEIAKVFINKIDEFYSISNVRIVNEAQVPNVPYNVDHTKDILKFAIIGILSSLVYVIVLNLLDTTIKTTDEIEEMTKLPILASVPIYGISKNKTGKTNINELIMHKDPKSPISEVFRTLRTNIQFINNKKKTKVILITSTVPGEGKSWISSNIATAFAQSRKNCNAH